MPSQACPAIWLRQCLVFQSPRQYCARSGVTPSLDCPIPRCVLGPSYDLMPPFTAEPMAIFPERTAADVSPYSQLQRATDGASGQGTRNEPH